MFDSTEDWCKIWRKNDLCFQNDMGNLANFHRLKNRDFILGSKMAELNQKKKKKFKTTRSTRYSVKILFYLGKKRKAQLAKLFTHALQIVVLKV